MLYCRFLKCVLLNFVSNVDKDVGIKTHTFYRLAMVASGPCNEEIRTLTNKTQTMKNLLISVAMKMKFVLFLGIMALPNFTIAQKMFSQDQREVYNTIVLIGNAWAENKIDTLSKYIDKEYLHTDVMGQALNKDSWLNSVKDMKEKGIKIPGVQFEDIDIRIYNDFAFVTGMNMFSIAGNAGDLSDKRKLRFTQVLRKENKTWKRLLFQATYIKLDK